MTVTPYVALVGAEFVEAADSLPDLLALLAEVLDPDVDEDVAVWHGGRLVVVLHPDGSQTWLRSECRPATPAAA
jgi:hypothetical protein